MAVRLDEMDRKILAELQADASQSLDEIARKVGSSKTPVWNRIRRMREAGVILRQTALLDAEALGLEACFFVLIRTSEHEAEWQRKFLKACGNGPRCSRRTGWLATSTISSRSGWPMRGPMTLSTRRSYPRSVSTM